MLGSYTAFTKSCLAGQHEVAQHVCPLYGAFDTIQKRQGTLDTGVTGCKDHANLTSNQAVQAVGTEGGATAASI